MQHEKILGIVQPFRKLVVLLNIYMIGITTQWAFEYAREALRVSPDHLLHVATVVTAIFVPLTILTKSTFTMYWENRKESLPNDKRN